MFSLFLPFYHFDITKNVNISKVIQRKSKYRKALLTSSSSRLCFSLGVSINVLALGENIHYIPVLSCFNCE